MKGTTTTWAEFNGEEVDVVVGWYANKAEPENNYAGGVEIDYVAIHETGKYITDELSADELSNIEARVYQDANEQAAEARADYGDWLHDCRRDDRLTGDA